MKPADLRVIVEAMTAGPWEWTDGTLLWNEQNDICVLSHGGCEWNVSESDRTAIAALRNHAEALVELYEAVKAMRDVGLSDGREAMRATFAAVANVWRRYTAAEFHRVTLVNCGIRP